MMMQGPMGGMGMSKAMHKGMDSMMGGLGGPPKRKKATLGGEPGAKRSSAFRRPTSRRARRGSM